MTERRNQITGQLSKGFRQRVGLAQALIHDPDVIILDEPTSGLDPRQIVEIRELIKELGKEHTIILSTHILPEASMTCERLIIISEGQIVGDVKLSDGRAVAITGFNKGVYIYNSQNCTLKNLELDKPITRAAVSRDGKLFLLGDPFGSLYLASDDNQVFWEEALQAEVLFCRLDQEGRHALVFEKGGILSTFEFNDGTEETARFLELKIVTSVLDKREIWKKIFFTNFADF